MYGVTFLSFFFPSAPRARCGDMSRQKNNEKYSNLVAGARAGDEGT